MAPPNASRREVLRASSATFAAATAAYPFQATVLPSLVRPNTRASAPNNPRECRSCVHERRLVPME